MAANFWTSSQHRLIKSNERIFVSNPKDSQYLQGTEIRSLHLFFADFLTRLKVKRTHKSTEPLRQRVIATAIVYFKRFYLKNSFIDFDPQIIAPGCLYLASKVEESHTRCERVFDRVKGFYEADKLELPFDLRELHHTEYVIMKELDYNLLVYHPYRSLITYVSKSKAKTLLNKAWAIVNDSYRTHLILTTPPFLIALGSLYLASTLSSSPQTELESWFADLSVDIMEIQAVAKELYAMYVEWSKSSDLTLPEAVKLLSTLKQQEVQQIQQQQQQEIKNEIVKPESLS